MAQLCSANILKLNSNVYMYVLINQTNVYKTYKNEVNTIIKLVSH